MRKFLLHSLNILHIFIRLSLFFGLLAIAGISLFALSPVAYEEYLAYQSSKSEQETRASQIQQTSGRVAGENISSQLEESSVKIDFDQPYKLRILTEEVRFMTAIPTEELVNRYEGGGEIELFSFENTSLRPKLYELSLVGESGIYGIAEINDRFEEVTNTGYIELDPGEQVFITAFSLQDGYPESAPGLIDREIRVNVLIEEVDVEDTNLLPELP
jgi:hypothetical protein